MSEQNETAEKASVSRSAVQPVVMRTPTELSITCRDTEDSDYWKGRMETADKTDAEELLGHMIDLCASLASKNISSPGPTQRYEEGEKIYKRRFGERYIPF